MIITCNFFEKCTTTPLIGINRIATNNPTRIDGPRICQRKYRATAICRGPDQMIFRYVVSSMKRCASTDIKLTISPTVDSFLEALVNLSDWNQNKEKIY
jgi:hypothetical protein